MEMKIGIVGCGDISYAHGNAIRQTDCTRIIACADKQVSEMFLIYSHGFTRIFTDNGFQLALE